MSRKIRKEVSPLNTPLPSGSRTVTMASPAVSESSAALLRELVAHLRQNRTQLREEWARRITEAQLLTAEGRANKQIAAELCISIKTIEKHRQQVMNKLNIHDIAGLTRYAMAKGVIERGAQLTL